MSDLLEQLRRHVERERERFRVPRQTTFSLDDEAVEFGRDGSRITTPFGELVKQD